MVTAAAQEITVLIFTEQKINRAFKRRYVEGKRVIYFKLNAVWI